MQIDREFLLTSLLDLLSIDSSNPSLVPGGAGEAQICVYLSRICHDLGFQTWLCEHETGRVSLLARLPGVNAGAPSTRSRTLMLNAHTDTVAAGGMSAPFNPRLENGRVYGRGAQDMKGSLAACLAAMKAVRDSGVICSGDLLLAAVADEEYASIGTVGVIELLAAQNALPGAALVTEPTGMQIAAAHRGFAWLTVTTHGSAAHGSRWWEGIDANRMMGRVLVGLDELAAELTKRPPHPLVGPPSLHTPLIKGGSELSTYADRCELHIERRTVPGESEDSVRAEIQAVLDRLAIEDAAFNADLALDVWRQPFEVQPDSALIATLGRASQEVLGQPAEIGGVSFWTDAALLAAAGVDTALFGPLGAGLHSDEEWVELESCVRLAEVLAQAAVDYLAQNGV